MNIGELFVFGYNPRDLDFLKDLAQKHGLGGVILFERNLESPEKLSEELDQLKKATGGPIIVSIDQEGGPVNRAKQDFPLFPSPRYYGDRNDISGIKVMARTTAKHLLALGINTNLAPVCDVLTNPNNLLMQKRTFGDSPELVTKCAHALISAYHNSHLLCCAKHFPGLGSAEIDPHEDVSVTEIDEKEFREVHMKPFKKAVEAGVDIIMTTHLLAKSLDSSDMIVFSKKVISKYLRGELGFEGVIITDDLIMGAVRKNFPPEESALKALTAGHDMIMMCHHKIDQESAFNSILDSYNNGRVDRDEIFAKIERVKKLKEKLLSHASYKKTSV